ncbi:MAG: EAL domain-containing protein [Pseudomonadota bacterium]
MSRKHRADLPPGAENPLNAAVAARDRSTIDMVTQAVAHNQTLLAYQPVVVTHNRKIGFYEGLIRIMDDTGRVIPARDFMPVVEKDKLGREIDALALNMGLRTLFENPSLRLSINMSAHSIGYDRWLNTVRRWLKKDNTLGERLILEITETSALDQPEIVINFMERMAEHGICFALDDFGAGYTSLRYLKDFYFDILKIDMSYCNGIAHDPDLKAMVGAMMSIGRHFDMLVVAEGVERAEDVDVLAELGVDCMQGFYFDAPKVRPNWMFGERRGQRNVQARAC